MLTKASGASTDHVFTKTESYEFAPVAPASFQKLIFINQTVENLGARPPERNKNSMTEWAYYAVLTRFLAAFFCIATLILT